MLFNSYAYLLVFLPLTVTGYFAFGRWLARYPAVPLAWLLVASVFFYGYWNPAFLTVLVPSVVLNYALGLRLARTHSRPLLLAAIIANLTALAYFKYATFFAQTVLSAWGLGGSAASIPLPPTPANLLWLPLGVSFFTFTQIAFLVDCWSAKVKETNPLHYGLFVTFFPHLLAGPILHHREMMPQFADGSLRRWSFINGSEALQLIAIGLGKKVLLADPLGHWANFGFSHIPVLQPLDAWITAIAYAMQLYFDFSGYCDIALGSALLFNIRMPINFQSPYRSTNIQAFWRRWHITLGRFLRDYLYIPLGGNRQHPAAVLATLFFVFVAGGLWHGAAWTFIIWGAIHGVALVVHRLWQSSGRTLPAPLGWLLTAMVVLVAWVFFRATTVSDAWALLQQMAGVAPAGLPPAAPPTEIAPWRAHWAPANLLSVGQWFSALTSGAIAFVVGVVVLAWPRDANVIARVAREAPARGLSIWRALLLAAVAYVAMIRLDRPTEFVYFIF